MSAQPLDDFDPEGDGADEFPDRQLKDWFDAEIEQRRGKVLLMKLAGATFATIAAEVGVSMSTVRKDYKLALAAQMQETPEVRTAVHRAVLTDILRSFYPAMLDGQKDAALVILKALERDARLGGYDAPTRILAAVSDREYANEAARLISRIQEFDPATLKELTRVHRPQRPILDGEVIEPDPAAPIAEAVPDTSSEEAEPDLAGVELVALNWRSILHPACAPGDLGTDTGPADPGEEQIHRSAGRAADAGRPQGGPVRPAGESGGPGSSRQTAPDPESIDSTATDDLDGWSNID